MGHGFADKAARSVTLPFDVAKKSDPLTQALTGNKVSFNADKNLDAGLGAAYKDDAVGSSLLTENDYKKTGKIAAAAAAAYFTGGAALNYMGGSEAGAGAGAALDTGSLTAEDLALEPGIGGATSAEVGSTASEIADFQGVGGTGEGLTGATTTDSTSWFKDGTLKSIAKQAAPFVISSLLKPKTGSGGNADGAAAPTVQKPVAMPTTNSAAVAAAKKKSIIQQMANRGRASTILTGNSDILGG